MGKYHSKRGVKRDSAMLKTGISRNDKWLESRMYFLWDNHFCDVPRKNKVEIHFGRKAVVRLGSIRKLRGKKADGNQYDDKTITKILITRFFQSETVPQFVVDAVIAHELIHYADGFSSPLSKKVSHPHRGGRIKKQMRERGLNRVYEDAEEWLRKNWRNVVKSEKNML